MRVAPLVLVAIGIWGLFYPETLLEANSGGGRWVFAVIIILGTAVIWRVRIMTESAWNGILIALWAVALALLTVFGLGLTHVFSFLFGEKHVLVAADAAFPLMSVLYGFLLWRFAPRGGSFLFKITALLLPCLLLWFLLF